AGRGRRGRAAVRPGAARAVRDRRRGAVPGGERGQHLPPARARPMTAASRRTAAGLAALVLGLAPLAGCGDFPTRPPDPVTAFVPSEPPVETPTGLTPDGFDAVQRMAVRIRNVGCGSLSTGSGFAVDATTLITNKHVVADSAELQ